ncbi:DNA ligase 1-like [Armigeres subalbatus]|uniref:DNA ligase 1-like n=1 Tax=Armigeres subalbatus TaxID=124917 RepID=UPI002ED2C30D
MIKETYNYYSESLHSNTFGHIARARPPSLRANLRHLRQSQSAAIATTWSEDIVAIFSAEYSHQCIEEQKPAQWVERVQVGGKWGKNIKQILKSVGHKVYTDPTADSESEDSRKNRGESRVQKGVKEESGNEDKVKERKKEEREKRDREKKEEEERKYQLKKEQEKREMERKAQEQEEQEKQEELEAEWREFVLWKQDKLYKEATSSKNKLQDDDTGPPKSSKSQKSRLSLEKEMF